MFSDEVLKNMIVYNQPGNIRELEHVKKKCTAY
jgi:transcriptional regulator with GAF, ATPase, and Fis domain